MAAALFYAIPLIFFVSSIGCVGAPSSKVGCGGPICVFKDMIFRKKARDEHRVSADGLVSLGQSDNGHQPICTGVVIKGSRRPFEAVLTTASCALMLLQTPDNVWATFEDGQTVQIAATHVTISPTWAEGHLTIDISTVEENYAVITVNTSVKHDGVYLPFDYPIGWLTNQVKNKANVFVAGWGEEGNTTIKTNGRIRHVSECNPDYPSTSASGKRVLDGGALCVTVDDGGLSLSSGTPCYLKKRAAVLLGLYSHLGENGSNGGYFVNVLHYLDEIYDLLLSVSFFD